MRNGGHVNGWVAAAIVVLTALDLHTYAQLSRRVRALEEKDKP